MPNSLYGTAQAGLNNYLLFEELADTVASNGYVYLQRTSGRSRRNRDDPTKGEYPSVYEVIYVPLTWDRVTQDQVEKFYALGEKHGAKVEFTTWTNSQGKTQFAVRFQHR
jgi:hypothetical protein